MSCLRSPNVAQDFESGEHQREIMQIIIERCAA
jgi:hypothetical protein